MISFSEAIQLVRPRHRRVLTWFSENQGEIKSWPQPLNDGNGTLLVTRAKGIYKPYWTDFAVSVRKQLSSEYPDSPVEKRPDGTWRFFYFQENLDPGGVNSQFTNRGLLACMKQSVPIGVLQQISGRPSSRYEILGPAMVMAYDSGFFVLEGFSEAGEAHDNGLRSNLAARVKAIERELDFDEIVPDDEDENVGREFSLRWTAVRQGQPDFRARLLLAYDGRCAITGCDVPDALEAAHILPYQGSKSNTLDNGLLLQADIHTLFDRGLIGIDPSKMEVVIAPELLGTTYERYKGQSVRYPDAFVHRPRVDSLASHLRKFDLG